MTPAHRRLPATHYYKGKLPIRLQLRVYNFSLGEGDTMIGPSVDIQRLSEEGERLKQEAASLFDLFAAGKIDSKTVENRRTLIAIEIRRWFNSLTV
jgi:hypothetical protein